jgi:heat-inducible transcriptional repressor
MVLNPRAEVLLKTLIERYIADGQPVGSRALARETRLDLSPATVRNVMSDLEELGMIRAPHTSAGRVPTEKGYRLFVDTLMKVQPLNAVEVNLLKGELKSDQDPQHLIEAASHVLSEVSHLAGLVLIPKREEHTLFRQVDFVPLTGHRVLVILVTQDGQVSNRVIATDREYSPSELTEAANCFNESHAGKSLIDVRLGLLADMQAMSEDVTRTMQLAVSMAHRAFEGEGAHDDLVVRGESNLMEFPEMGDVKRLRRLFDAFNTKRDLLNLLDRSLNAGGVKIFIGSESGFDAFADCSLVTAPYQVDGEIVGTLGVIGPTRMAYQQMIPIVDITAKLLSNALSLAGGRGSRLES